MAVNYDPAPAEVNWKQDAPAPTQQMRRAPDGKQAPMVFPTGGDLQTGNPTYNGAPQQGQGTPAPKGAPQQAPTFRTLQMQGQARPAPPPTQAMVSEGALPVSQVGGPATQQQSSQQQPMQQQSMQQQSMQQQPSQGQFQFGGSALGGSVQQLLQQMMSNPTAYNDDVIQAQRQAGMGRLDQDGAMQKARLDEEMAGRGLFSSTIAQGRLGDIDINRQNAMADMESRFLADRAKATDEGRYRAAGLGMDYDRLAFDQQAEGQRLGLQRDDLDFRRGDAQANRAQRGSEFDRSYGLDRDQFGEDRRQFDVDQGRRGSEFDKTYGLDRDKFGEDQRQFDVDSGLKREDLGLRRDMFGEDTRRDNRNFDADRDDESWGRNLDYYDIYNNSDLLDLTGYGQEPQAPPPPPKPRNARDFGGIRALQEWGSQYGSGR